jgi:hypothetical protein
MHVTSADVGLTVGGLGFVAAGVASLVTWRVSIANNRAAHRAWLRQKRADAYLNLIGAINMRQSCRHRGDLTMESQTLVDVTLFGSLEVRAAFAAALNLDERWADPQGYAGDAVTMSPQRLGYERQVAQDALTAAEDIVLSRIRAEVADTDLDSK